MTVTLTNLEILNIVEYANSENAIVNTPNKFSAKFAWNWRKNIKKLRELNNEFVSLQQDLINYYSNDEYSYVNDEDNRVLKDEYIQEYNEKLQELYMESNEIDINEIKIDNLVPGGIDALDEFGISVTELDLLSFMIAEE